MPRDDRPTAPDSRRRFLRKALYATPAVLTLTASPAFASYGSGSPVPGGLDTFADRLRSLFRGWFA